MSNIIRAVADQHDEVCPYCRGTGKMSPSPATRIVALRQQHKLNQSEFANMIGISRGQIANMESGRTNFSTDLYIRISDKFGVSIDWLLGRDK